MIHVRFGEKDKNKTSDARDIGINDVRRTRERGHEASPAESIHHPSQQVPETGRRGYVPFQRRQICHDEVRDKVKADGANFVHELSCTCERNDAGLVNTSL